MKKRDWYLLGILFVLFCVSRIRAAWQAGSYWFDEMFSVHFASMPLKQMWQYLQYEHNPLWHFLTLHVWMQFFGSGEVAVRMLSVCVGVLSFILLFLLAKKLYSTKTALWSLFFFTFSSLMLYHQTEARMYAWVVLFTLTSIHAFWQWYRSKTKRMRSLLVLTASLILLVHSHITALVVPIALFLFWLSADRSRIKQEYRQVLAAMAAVMASVLVWFIPVLVNTGQSGQISQGWFFLQTGESFWFSHLVNFLMIGEPTLLLRSLAALVLGAILFVGLFRVEQPGWWQQVFHLFRRNRASVEVSIHLDDAHWLLLLLLLVPLLLGFAVQVTVTKYLIAACVPCFILLGEGMTRLGRWKLQAFAALVILMLVLPIQLRLLFVKRHHWDEVGQTVAALHQQYPQAKIVVHSFAWKLLLDRYLPSGLSSTGFYPLSDNLSFDDRVVRYNWQGLVNHDNVQQLASVVRNAQAVILVSSTPDAQQQDPVKAWFWQNGYRLSGDLHWSGYGDPEVLLLTHS